MFFFHRVLLPSIPLAFEADMSCGRKGNWLHNFQKMISTDRNYDYIGNLIPSGWCVPGSVIFVMSENLLFLTYFIFNLNKMFQTAL